MMQKVPLTRPQRVLELLSAFFMGWMLVDFLLRFGALPDTVPTHYGAGGVPDAWGPKGTLQVVPILGVLLYVLLTGLSLLPKALTATGAGPAAPVPPARLAVLRYFFLGPKLVMGFSFFWITRCTLGGQDLGAFFTPLVLGAVALSILLPAYRLWQMGQVSSPGS